MKTAHRGNRLHIALVGRCNTGKSSVLNRIVGQSSALVSEQPGTTADPVGISFELLPYGPVLFYDTAGLDEFGPMGELRRNASRKIIARSDMVLLVTDERGVGPFEREMIAQVQQLDIPLLVVCNKVDIRPSHEEDVAFLRANTIPFLQTSAHDSAAQHALRHALLGLAPDAEKEPVVVVDLLPPHGLVVCVVPIDASAPKGRLIAPQVQVLRELAEHQHMSLLTQPATLPAALARLATPPELVVTDSQAVKLVAEIVPDTVPLTTFSLLFARLKGDFPLQVQGVKAIPQLLPNAPVLVAEACGHHAQEDDIARVKLPQALQKFLNHPLQFEFCSGKDFPDDLARYKLVLHCGGCMLTSREMQRRLKVCTMAQVPVTNYGMALSLCQGVLERVTRPFCLPGREGEK